MLVPRRQTRRVSHDLQLQSLWIIPAVAVSEHVFAQPPVPAGPRRPATPRPRRWGLTRWRPSALTT